MWQEYSIHIWPSRLQYASVGTLVIKRHSYYRRGKTQNRWCFIDAHFQDGVGSVSLSFLAMKAANTLLKTVFNLSHRQITQDTRPPIVAAPWTLIFRIWQGACVYSFWSLRGPIHRNWTVTYKCRYFKINNSISECDDTFETRNAEPEVGTNGSSQTRQDPRVPGYGSGIGLPRVRGSGFWTGLKPNWPVCAVQIRTAGGLPGPFANTISSSLHLNEAPGHGFRLRIG